MAGSIPNSFIKEIVEITDIVSLVDSYIPLKRKGKDHWGLCPFCDDGKHPSFSVSSQKQFYYCFKCRATGNVIGFLESFEGFNFVESVEFLAGKAALEVPYEKSNRRKEDFDELFEILSRASDFFQKGLIEGSQAKKVQSYIKDERKISAKTCREYQVGYAQDSWDALSIHLGKEGFSNELLIKSGLSKRNKENKLYDVFRDRLMFPIKDRKGRTVGFGGRVMNSKDQPKYLNTGETPVFKKGKELYGFFETSKERRDLKKIYVVEGYMDVIALAENGIKNAVATLGIATNRFHTQTLLQIVNEVIFCFDGDDAGRGAAWGALQNVLPVINDGVEIKFLFLPEKEDPASLLEKENKEEFEKRLKGSLSLSGYFFERLTSAVGEGTLEKKALLASRAMELLKSMPESSIKKLMEAEVSNITGLKKEDIKNETRYKSIARTNKTSFKKRSRDEKAIDTFEQDSLISKALSVLVNYPYLASEVDSVDWIKEISRPESDLFVEVVLFFQKSTKGTIAELLNALDEDSGSLIGSLLSEQLILEEKNSLKYFQDCLSEIKKTNPRKRIAELKVLLSTKDLSDEETFELQQHLLSNLDKLDQEDRDLLKELSY